MVKKSSSLFLCKKIMVYGMTTCLERLHAGDPSSARYLAEQYTILPDRSDGTGHISRIRNPVKVSPNIFRGGDCSLGKYIFSEVSKFEHLH